MSCCSIDGTCGPPPTEEASCCSAGSFAMPPPPRAAAASPCTTATLGTIGAAATALLAPDPPVGTATAEFTGRARSGVTLSGSAAHALASGAPSAWAQAEGAPWRGALATLRYDATGVASAALEASVGSALKLTAATASAAASAAERAPACPLASLALGAELTTRYVAAQARSDRVSRRTTASLVLAAPDPAAASSAFGAAVSCGASCAYDGPNRRLVERALRAGYAPRHGAYALAVFASDLAAPDTAAVGCSLHARAPAVGGSTCVATELVRARGAVALATAVSVELGGGSVGKARVGTDGLLHLSYKTRLEPAATLTVAAALDLNRPAQSVKFGLALALAP